MHRLSILFLSFSLLSTSSSGKGSFGTTSENADFSSVLNDVSFVEQEHSLEDIQATKRINASTETNYHPLNRGKLYLDYYTLDKDGKPENHGALYVTREDTEKTATALKERIGKLSAYLTTSQAYRGHFAIGDDFLDYQVSDVPNYVNAVFNHETLGRMADYMNIYLLNNPQNESHFYVAITHETYLEPTKSKHRYYKGVGVESKLTLPSDQDKCFLRDFAPTAQGPSKTVSYNWTASAIATGGKDASGSLSSGLSMGYSTNVESPEIVDRGAMPYLMDVCFEYVDPGSWYGPFCQYNSNQSLQCSLAVLQVRKDIDTFTFTNEIVGRFEKYQNWPFPWVDEYYSIPYQITLDGKKMKQIIAQANR